ncbi:transcription factor IIF subunit tfg1 [Coemansia erecta]|uniref:Transcription initiation factor IIF subunit alpha n=1 Tax=Coemansia erecta TaxID=147472 RepID=A0A9W7XUA5_9FUNG|nr:transcription factor IIF subunit tfg1 [Coemansia erecta]
MSSGMRSAGKKPATGSAGIRVFGSRSASAGMRARPQPTQQRPQQVGRPRGNTDADIPLAAATGLAAPDMRTSVEYTLVSARPRRTHNVMRFQSPQPVDPSTFTAPVKLRRRNKEYYRLKNKKRNEERAAALELEQANGAAGTASAVGAGAVAPEPEKKDERPKADMSLIADVGGARSNKKNLFKKRTKQVFFADEEKRRLDIEEARPWMLEDDDEKEVWNGSLEGGQKAAHVLFVLTENGFKVVPVDRWYKFLPKQNFKTLTIEEAEAELQRAHKAESHDRWIMRKRLQALDDNAEKEAAAAAQAASAAKSRSSLVEYEARDDVFGDFDDDDDEGGGGSSSKRRKAQSSGKHGDADEFGFELEFDDDEELGDVQFEYNEDESIEKKEQQRNANRTGYDSDGELDDADENADDNKRDLEAENMKKLMRKREGNVDYDSDVEENPYLSVSDYSDDEDEDNQDDAKKAQQQAAAADQATGSASPTSAAASATATTTTGTGATAPAAGASSGSVSPTSPTQPQGSASAPSGAKKRKRGPGNSSHPPTRSTGPVPKPRPSTAGPDVITKQEIIDLIRGGVSSTRELIGCLRRKLRVRPENKAVLQLIVREVATLREGPGGSILTLKNL